MTTNKEKSKKVYNQFCKVFGKVTTIDGALSKVQDRGYGYYFNGKYTNKESINRIKKGLGINCTDATQLFYHIAVTLGYSAKCIHVKCSSGTGHVFLKLYHKKNTEGNWIYRDPAAVLSKNGKGVRAIWCKNGKVQATNPGWWKNDLYK